MNKLKLTLAAATVIALGSASAVSADQAMVDQIIKEAVPVARANNLYPSVAIAQALLESSYGESGLAVNYHNLFGVKWTGGESVTLMTKEVVDGTWIDTPQPFQVYPTFEDSFQGYAQLIRSNPLYTGVWRENAPTYQDATANLQGTYATDDSYASKLNYVIESNNLTQYDVEPEKPKAQPKPKDNTDHTAKVESEKLFSGLHQSLKKTHKLNINTNPNFEQLNIVLAPK